MAKKKWDGNFEEAYWVERDNPVEELIENSGRILREPTSDGYTHDIVYRGGYISEDYYFPNPERSNRHDHYELHTNGEVVVNGKIITAGGNYMAGKLKTLSRNPESAHVRKRESEEKQSEFRELIDLGTEFENDRLELDKNIEMVEMSDASDEYKEKARIKYEYAIEKLKEKYDRDVRAAEEKIEQQMMEQEERDKESGLEHKRVAAELEKSKLNVSDEDMAEAIEQAEKDAQEMENIAKSLAEKRTLLKEQADMQRRNIHAQRLRGRN